jgi:phosphatidylglycerol---prolipoprotein diacylglyceryl transferase
MPGPFVHNLDPIIFSIFGVHAWWYGLSFTLGFLNLHLFLRRFKKSIGLSRKEVYDLTLFICIGILIGGRALIVLNNEWSFYRENLLLIPSIWVGGFATHGLILGGAAGVVAFCLINRVPFRPIFDILTISAAIILGFGRIGNFIDGQIHGSVTDVPWGVKFPNVEGFRHPVVLYDGIKNFLLAPLLLWLRSFDLPPGRIAAVFVIAYAGLRFPIDLFREYPITMWGLPTGQTLNVIMLLLGIGLLLINLYRAPSPCIVRSQPPDADEWLRGRKIALAVCCLIPLVIPSDATRDIPVTYGHRHPGLDHSWMYPPIAEDLRRTDQSEKGR